MLYIPSLLLLLLQYGLNALLQALPWLPTPALNAAACCVTCLNKSCYCCFYSVCYHEDAPRGAVQPSYCCHQKG